MNDFHAIANRIEESGYPIQASLIRTLHSETVNAVTLALNHIRGEGRVEPEELRDLEDFVWNARSYR